MVSAFNLLRVNASSIKKDNKPRNLSKPEVTSGLVRHKCPFVILTKVNKSTSN